MMRRRLRASAAAFCVATVGFASAAGADVAPSRSSLDTLRDAEAAAQAHERNADAALNAGLAAAELDDLGLAVLWLERAALLAPFDREIEDALQAAHREARRVRAERFASGTLVEGEPPALFWWRFLQAIGVAGLAGTLLVCNAAGFLVLALARRSPQGSRRDLLHVAAAALLAAALGSAATWSVRTVLSDRVDPAIVLPEDARGRGAPDELATLRRQPELFAGAVVLIEEERDAWRRVRLINGDSVWLLADEIERIRLR